MEVDKFGSTEKDSGRCHLKILNALIIDGSGGPGEIGDIAVETDRIAAVGKLANWVADETIDASGLVASPGFIDVHTHDELAALNSRDMVFKVSQGVTSVIAGNCGLSLAPFESGRGFPPPFPVLGSESEFNFPRVADYRRKFESSPASLNLALLAGHSSMRVAVMGESLQQSANAKQIEAMRVMLRNALEDGCIGMSTGLNYPPAIDSSTDEIVFIASVLKEFDQRIYVSHIRNEGDRVLQAVEETLEIGRRASTAVVISHHKCSGPKNYGRSVETLEAIESGRQRQQVGLDVYPYTASSTTLMARYIQSSERVLIASSQPCPEMAGRELSDVAAEWQCSEEEAVERLCPASAIYFQMHEDDLQRILSYPLTMIGSDGLPGPGKPHPRLWGTFPRVLGRYVREKKLLTIEQAVHKMTGLSATTFSIKDRGFIHPGYFADITLFDPNLVIDKATYEHSEVPAEGIRRVLVNGKPVWQNGNHTGQHPGEFLDK